MRRALCLTALCALLILCLVLPCRAAENGTEELLRPLKDAPSFITDPLPEDITDTEALREAVGMERLFSLLVSGFTDAFSTERGSLLRLLGTALLFSIATLFVKSRGVTGMLNSAAAVTVYGVLERGIARMMTLLSELATFSGVIAPIYTGVLAAGGNTSVAASGSYGFAAFLSIVQTLGSGVLIPLLRTLFALSLISGFGEVPAVGELSRGLRNTYLFVLSLLCALLGASLAFQTSLASSADSVAMRTVKFALGNAIPVVGGSVSAALGSLSASVSLIRGTLGTSAAVVLLSLVLPAIAELALLRFALSVCEGVSAALGAGAVGGLFARFRSLYDLMLATVAILSVLFLILSGVLASIPPAVTGA